MHTLIRPLATALFLAFAAPAAVAVTPAKDPHHVMWTTKKGKAKCMNKGSKEKAEKCAAKLHQHNATNVQVMAGPCSSM